VTHHEFQMPVRVEEIRRDQRVEAMTPDVAPAAPVSTDDGTPLVAAAPAPPAPAAR
jgi:hypothetical protein